jgi:hypothetical protein
MQTTAAALLVVLVTISKQATADFHQRATISGNHSISPHGPSAGPNNNAASPMAPFLTPFDLPAAGGGNPNSKCGVIWFYHIPKTGGASTVNLLKAYSRKSDVKHLNLFEIQYRKHCCSEGEWESHNLGKVENFVLNSPSYSRPGWVQHHHRGPMLHQFMPTLKRWRKALVAKGCYLWLATVLREPHSRSISAVHYNAENKQKWQQKAKCWGQEHRSLQMKYILFNHMHAWLYGVDAGHFQKCCNMDPAVLLRNDTTNADSGITLPIQWDDSSPQYLSAASTILKNFDLIARTVHLASLLRRMAEILNMPYVAAPHTNRSPQNIAGEGIVRLTSPQTVAGMNEYDDVLFKRYAQPQSVRLSVLFVVENSVPFMDLWASWAAPYNAEVDFFVLAKFPEQLLQSRWAKFVVPLGAVSADDLAKDSTTAMLMVFTEAFRPGMHPQHRFMFVSDATLPVLPMRKVLTLDYEELKAAELCTLDVTEAREAYRTKTFASSCSIVKPHKASDLRRCGTDTLGQAMRARVLDAVESGKVTIQPVAPDCEPYVIHHDASKQLAQVIPKVPLCPWEAPQLEDPSENLAL